MASSEDDKAVPIPSTLESVTEKPAEDHTSDKVSDEVPESSKMNKTDEEKLNEVSDATNEDLVPKLLEPSKDIISEDLTEHKQENQADEIPVEPVILQPEEESVNEADAKIDIVDGQETEEEQKETKEEKTEDELSQEIKEERDQEERKKEDQREDGVEESKEQPEVAPQEPELVSGEVAQVEEENHEPEKELPQHKVTGDMEDTADSIDMNQNTENINADVSNGDGDTNLNGESPAVLLSEEEAIESQPKEERKVEAPEETEQPEQDIHLREDKEAEEQVPTESTNVVCKEAGDTSDNLEHVVPCKDVLAGDNVEEATHADKNISQDAVSVPESETDSESKIEHGSPAVIKPDMEKDSDSGSSSAADNNSLDLNLSISSFLSKSKEGGSVSLQV